LVQTGEKARKEVREMVKIGQVVLFTDSMGRDHEALVTAVWTETCINVVYVSGDEARQDPYGRQTEHVTSVVHARVSGVHGFNWRMPGEAKPEYHPPLAT